MIKTIAIAGAGTMGSGIALAAALQHYKVILFDTNSIGVQQAKLSIGANINFLVAKNKISSTDGATVYNHINFTCNINDCIADVVIEAIIENLAIKKTLYQTLAAINQPTTILASNTSSLSITNIQAEINLPERVCGMHFFNPAHIMKLVEVVAGKKTSTTTIDTIYNLCISLQKQPVICADAPGFIVNRVARHFYLEAMHMANSHNINFADIDKLMQNAGFKMGPFALMDLIGLDVNYAVSKSVYEAFNKQIRFTPSPMQATKVAEGKLGKKTSVGFYNYQKKTEV